MDNPYTTKKTLIYPNEPLVFYQDSTADLEMAN